MSREIIEKCVNLGLLLGFVILVLGVLLWLLEISARFRFTLATSLVVGGVVFLIFALLATKIVSAMD